MRLLGVSTPESLPAWKRALLSRSQIRCRIVPKMLVEAFAHVSLVAMQLEILVHLYLARLSCVDASRRL